MKCSRPVPVVALTPPAKSSRPACRVGDTVVYSKYGGTEITVDGEDLLILSGRDVLATVTK